MIVWEMRCTSRGYGHPPKTLPVGGGVPENGGLDHDAATLAEARQAVASWQSYNNAWTYELIIPKSYSNPTPRTILEDV